MREGVDVTVTTWSEATSRLFNFYDDRCTVDEYPTLISELREWPGNHGFYFAVVKPKGTRSLVKVGPRGSVTQLLSFSATGWEQFKSAVGG